jgi:hypothetical protein
MAINIGKGSSNIGTRLDWIGLDTVLKNINDSLDDIEGVTVSGLLEAALLVKGDAQRITPVDTSNLKASAYVIWGGGKKQTKIQAAAKAPNFKSESKKSKRKVDVEAMIAQHINVLNKRSKPSLSPFAEVGYTASYAAKVHEDLNASHVKKGRRKVFGRSVKASIQIGQAKFLEQSFIKNARRIKSIIKGRLGV